MNQISLFSPISSYAPRPRLSIAEPTRVPQTADSISFLFAWSRRPARRMSLASIGLRALNHARPFVSLARISISILVSAAYGIRGNYGQTHTHNQPHYGTASRMVGPPRLVRYQPAGNAFRAGNLLRRVYRRTAHAHGRFRQTHGIIQPGYAFPIPRPHAHRSAHHHRGRGPGIAGTAGPLAVSAHPFRALAGCAARRWRARGGLRYDLQQAGPNGAAAAGAFRRSGGGAKKGAGSQSCDSFDH